MFVNNDIRKEMYKGADANADCQFKKLFIYHMENVSILFADIKVFIRLFFMYLMKYIHANFIESILISNFQYVIFNMCGGH